MTTSSAATSTGFVKSPETRLTRWLIGEVSQTIIVAARSGDATLSLWIVIVIVDFRSRSWEIQQALFDQPRTELTETETERKIESNLCGDNGRRQYKY